MTSSAYLTGCALATLAPLLSHARQIKFAAVAAHIASIAHSSALCRSQQKVAPLHLTDVTAVPTLPLLHFLAANAHIIHVVRVVELQYSGWPRRRNCHSYLLPGVHHHECTSTLHTLCMLFASVICHLQCIPGFCYCT